MTLHLTLKKKWFDMILSGEKREEYREVKKYWIKRLMPNTCLDLREGWKSNAGNFKEYQTVAFTNGYSKNAPAIMVECKGIEIGKSKPEWSDNWQGDVFIIKLGKILETKNI